MDNNKTASTALIIGVIVVVGILFVWNRCKLKCEKNDVENYMSPPSSQGTHMKRSPVSYMYRDDPYMSNPHIRNNPDDELIPLNAGTGVDLDKNLRKIQSGKAFEEFEDCYEGPHEGKEQYLPNDHKTRSDLLDAGELPLYRALQNEPDQRHKIVGLSQKYQTEADQTEINPMLAKGEKYHPSYFNRYFGN